MTALRAHRRGGPEQLVVERAPVPAPAAGEVLVAVYAAAITFDELTWEETWSRDGVSRTPVIPSHEVSGVVQETAPAWPISRPATGVRADSLRPRRRGGRIRLRSRVRPGPKPSTVSHAVAAALPLAGLTAWQALVDHAGVQPGSPCWCTGARAAWAP